MGTSPGASSSCMPVTQAAASKKSSMTPRRVAREWCHPPTRSQACPWADRRDASTCTTQDTSNPRGLWKRTRWCALQEGTVKHQGQRPTRAPGCGPTLAVIARTLRVPRAGRGVARRKCTLMLMCGPAIRDLRRQRDTSRTLLAICSLVAGNSSVRPAAAPTASWPGPPTAPTLQCTTWESDRFAAASTHANECDRTRDA